MLDQADKLRQLVRSTVAEHAVLEPGISILAVSGARRGVGSSTVAVQLTHELAQLGKRILLVDGNLQAPQLATALGFKPNYSLADVIDGRRAVAEALESLCEGVHFLGGNPVTELPKLDLKTLKRFVSELRSMRSHADLIVFDLGHGMNPWTERLWAVALEILLVTSTESAAVLESYATIKGASWGDVDGKLRLIVNQAESPAEGQRVSDSFTTTCRRFLGMKLLTAASVLPMHPGLRNSTERVSSASPLHRALRLLAADVLSRDVVATHRTSAPPRTCATGNSPAAPRLNEHPELSLPEIFTKSR